MRYDFSLGPWSRQVTTEVAEAQLWFDRGLNWTYAYNHEEAVVCFRHAARADPNCAMAHWGIALAGGPFYNRPWIRYSDAEIREALPLCHRAILTAQGLADTASPAERALISALARRYPRADCLDRTILHGWHLDYADAMRAVHATHPDDPDIAALYVEAAVTCTPRQLWNLKTGQPESSARTHEVMPVLDDWLARMTRDGPVHPGLAHMVIHALEMSPFPERAMPAADMLVGYAPDAGHLDHMAAHVDVLCGDYARAVDQSERAVRADDRYLAHAGDRNFYTTARCHDLHLLIFAAMFLGHYGKASGAARRLSDMATPELIADSPPFMASILDGYGAMQIHVLVRFGRWLDLVSMPPPTRPELRPIGVAMHAYGQGIAHATLGNFVAAGKSQRAFAAALSAVSPDAIFLSNPVRDILGVGGAMLGGEIEYHLGNHERAFAALQQAVARDDALNYTEPWAWMHPPRHALGALLAEQGRFAEAEAIFRADLGLDDSVQRCSQHPDNIWALRGLDECLAVRDAPDRAAIRARLDAAQSRADMAITAACFCRKAPVSGGGAGPGGISGASDI